MYWQSGGPQRDVHSPVNCRKGSPSGRHLWWTAQLLLKAQASIALNGKELYYVTFIVVKHSTAQCSIVWPYAASQHSTARHSTAQQGKALHS